MLFLFLEIIFLFFDLDCQNLATLGFDNCPISEKENYLSEKKVRMRVFPSLCNLFPATRNIYSPSFDETSFLDSYSRSKKDIQLLTFAYKRLLNKPNKNGVTLTTQNSHSKCYQNLETYHYLKKSLDL